MSSQGVIDFVASHNFSFKTLSIIGIWMLLIIKDIVPNGSWDHSAIFCSLFIIIYYLNLKHINNIEVMTIGILFEQSNTVKLFISVLI